MALHSAVTSITHNIPGFLRDPAVAIIGERCYSILVYDFDLSHQECFKYALSKVLGLGIVLGGSIVKVPQILKIISSQSARGLSLPAYILETISYAISLAYAARNHFPFTTYGENLFLTAQNVIITLLIVYYGVGGGLRSGGPDNIAGTVTGVCLVVAAAVFLRSPTLCPSGLLGALQAATLPVSLISKAPQIISNHQNKSTGNLSAFAVFNAFFGCVARLFTTTQEVNDNIVFLGFLGAAVLNLVLVVQMLVYWKNPDVEGRHVKYAREDGLGQGEIIDEKGRRRKRD